MEAEPTEEAKKMGWNLSIELQIPHSYINIVLSAYEKELVGFMSSSKDGSKVTQ